VVPFTALDGRLVPFAEIALIITVKVVLDARPLIMIGFATEGTLGVVKLLPLLVE